MSCPTADPHLSPIEFNAVSCARFLRQQKPSLRNIPHPFQLALHLCVFGFHDFGTCVPRNVNRRRKQNHRARKGRWQQKVVPRLLKRFPALRSDMKHHDRAARFSRQHHRSRLRNIARPTWPVDRERAIDALFQAPCHHRQSAQSAARRASLRRAKSQPLNHFACPLPVERCRVHHHHTVISVPPHDRYYHPVPERPDALLLRRIYALCMLPSKHFVSQRRPKRPNDAVHSSRNDRNLNSPRPRQIRQPRVVVSAYRFLFGLLRGLNRCVWRRHHLFFYRRVQITRRIV
jgi:hypothetical protein